ncbi:hypothetical protein ACFFX0_32155 [Citricoccus parietis]|uniref:Uncharacterized protein n=1 Tax=Citricoccus parietis TaxID=592307 RepID=A0ABV5G9C4_9MICC
MFWGPAASSGSGTSWLEVYVDNEPAVTISVRGWFTRYWTAARGRVRRSMVGSGLFAQHRGDQGS